MLRTSSDGADVVLEEGGMEWEVVNPHGTSKGRDANEKVLVRRYVWTVIDRRVADIQALLTGPFGISINTLGFGVSSLTRVHQQV